MMAALPVQAHQTHFSTIVLLEIMITEAMWIKAAGGERPGSILSCTPCPAFYLNRQKRYKPLLLPLSLIKIYRLNIELPSWDDL
eukprot:1162065-Pelagomonas_calceolata.AAC.10